MGLLTTVTLWWFFPELRSVQMGLYPPDENSVTSEKFDLAVTHYCKLLNFVCYMGAILGTFTAFALLKAKHQPHRAAWVCVIGGGLMSLVAVLAMYPFNKSSGEYMGYYSLLVIWSLLLLTWGLCLMSRMSRSKSRDNRPIISSQRI